MTTENTEGSEPTEQASPTDGDAATTSTMTQTPEPEPERPGSDTPSATPSATVPQDDTGEVLTATESAPTAAADPGTEADVDSSDSQLGDAQEMSSRVADAVDGMNAAASDESDATATSSEQGNGQAAMTADEPAEATAQAEGSNGADSATTDTQAEMTRAADSADAMAGATESGEDTKATDGAMSAMDGAEDMTGDETATATATAEPRAESGEAPSSDEAQLAPPAAAVYPPGPEPTTMEELLREQPGEIRSLKHGDVVEGTVVRIDKDEILVDIGAKSEGVVSNRELYGRNAESQPELNIGDTVLVYVLQPESQEGHAVLSLRRAGLERKWRSMQEQLDAGAIIEAPVIDHNKGGLIVDCGIRGFVPISQIVDFPRRPQNEQPRDAAQEIAEKLQPYVGRKLRLKILEVNRKANRLILSEKVALYEERREKRDELFSSLQVGQKVTGTVRSIAPFGVFVDLGGIDGLVHKSELSWNKVNNPEAGYKVGEEVEAEVIDINHERGRISLSIRRLQPDPWHSTVADLKVGDVIDGTVTKIVNFGAFVRVRDGLEGLIHISELSHQRVVHPGDVVHEGQSLKLKIISLDSERHRLGLSLKQAEEAPARPAVEVRERRPRPERSYDAAQAVQEPEGGIDNTLAAAFAQVRQQMEDTEAARRDTEPEASIAPAADEAARSLTEEAASADDAAREAMTDSEPETAAEPEATAAVETAEPETAAEPEATAAVETAEPETAAEPEATAAVETAEPETAAEPESPPEPEATAATETAEPEAEPEPETTAAPAPKPSRRKSAKAEVSAEPEAETSDEPAEGSADTAPAEGADREDGA